MDGSTLFKSNPSTPTSSFDRPPPLKPLTTTMNDFGKNVWSSNRNLWHGNGSLNARTTDNPANRRTQGFNHQDNTQVDEIGQNSLRQKSNSSVKFSKPSSGVALSPIDNPRVSGNQNKSPWASSIISPLNNRFESPLTSPVKPKQQAWPFPNDLYLGSENALLLHGSAPDIDPTDGPNARDTFGERVTSRFGYPSGGGELPFSNFQVPAARRPKSAYTFHGAAVTNGGSSAPKRQTNGAALTSSAIPTPRYFGTPSSSANGVQLTSPISNKYLGNHHRENFSNLAQQRGPSSMEDTLDSMRSLTLNGYATRISTARGGSDPFSIDEYAPVQGNQNGVGSGIAPVRFNAELADFQPSRSSNGFEATDDSNLPNYSSMWTYSDRDTTYSGDLRGSAQAQYYSAGATPPTGPDSGRSAGGSGISSRTSHHDFALVDRKLGNLDGYQQGPFYQGNGLISVNTPEYGLNLAPSIRMNPLAGNYTPYNMSGFSIPNVGVFSPTPRPPLRDQEPQVIRSALLEDFRMNSKTNKRYELRDIFDHVVEFSGDQHGSRFIQQKLETANSDEKDQIFREIQPNCLQLMTDVFGNYVIQKLFEHGNQSQKKVLANHMKGHILTLSQQMYGCRVVQKALEHVLTDQQASMVTELDGPNKQILKVIRDQNGNHVVQKAIERIPAEHIHFIIEAHRGEVVKLATHTYGCRVIQRILEHCQPAAKRIILDELHGCVAPLITDQFGNYVVQHVIQNGEPDDRRRVVAIVQQQLLNFSKHKFASNVVEKCIEFADEDQRADIVRRLIGHNEQGQTPVLGLLRDQYGNYVIQKVHSLLKGAELEALVNEMKLCFPQLKRTSYGKQVMAIEKLLYGMSNSTTTPSTSHSSSSSHVGPQGVPPQLLPAQQTYRPSGNTFGL